MLKVFLLLFCLSVTLGVGYSASNGTTNGTTTATPPTTVQPTNGSTTTKPTSTVKSTTGNVSTTAKPSPGNATTAKPTPGNATTAKPSPGNATTTKPAPGNVTTTKPAPGNATTTKPAPGNVTTTKPAPGNVTTTKPAPGNVTTTKPAPGNVTTTKPAPGNVTTTKPAPGNSTTAKPTTGNSTTAKPTSNGTTSALPTTTAKTTVLPTTTPPPAHGNFSLKTKKNGSEEYCLLAEFAVTFTIHYMAEDNSSKTMEKNATIYLNRTNSGNVSINGSCGIKGDAELILSWPVSKPYYTLTMVFSKTVKALEDNAKSDKWRVKRITLFVNMDSSPEFPNAKDTNLTGVFDGSKGPSYDVGGYYSCISKDGNVKFETRTNDTVDSVFEDVKLEPFVSKNTSDFGKDKYPCYQDNPTTLPTTPGPDNDIVPIAVGCALAGLVLIVLIAYIIGRRKSHRGYEKV